MILNLNIHHKLSQQEALSRIKNLFAKLKHDQKDKISDIKEDWNNEALEFQFTVMRFTVSGSLTVHESNVEMEAEVPFAIFLFRSKIKQVIRAKAKELFSE